MGEHVELHQAFQWTCPACGRQNFVSGITMELTSEERQQLEEEVGAGDFVAAPDEVRCSCGRCYLTAEPGDDK